MENGDLFLICVDVPDMTFIFFPPSVCLRECQTEVIDTTVKGTTLLLLSI